MQIYLHRAVDRADASRGSGGKALHIKGTALRQMQAVLAIELMVDRSRKHLQMHREALGGHLVEDRRASNTLNHSAICGEGETDGIRQPT
jgi:hypothetical protein